MDTNLNTFKKIQSGSLIIKRLQYHLTLYGIGFYLWVSYLWGLVLIKFKYLDEQSESWLFRVLYGDSPLKLYPIINFLDTVGLIVFFGFIAYAIVWIYADTQCKIADGEDCPSFKKHLLQVIIFNSIVYMVLQTASSLYINS